ncbi:MAG: DEAD/DEAH box helicase [Rikenellaceae bacterium]|jgi:ATP-dependent RNA helicase DeaD|nr:DEAD/DEAH box helicase [Rikenellaceae bacterium]
MINIEEFQALGLTEVTLKAIREKGFETPSPIQKLTIPNLLRDENDIIAQAQTGTGKTAAFGLPILEQIEARQGQPQSLVLVPTRELALQVMEEILSLNRKKISIAAIYGGASMSEQLRRIHKGIDIVVGTPGRILDHIRRETIDFSALRWLVLDEADEMLDMGFIEDVEEIMAATNETKRTMLFSATMPNRIAALSKKYMHDTEILRVDAGQITTDLTDQIYFEVREADKFDALTRIIDIEPDFYGIVFAHTKVGVDEMVNRLIERGYAAEGLHGDVSQAQREKTLKKFKKKLVNILVATDVAARGIDVNNLTHVINYSLPQDSESYVHRIGRTGRAGNEGTAITFISPSEYRRFAAMRKAVKSDIRKEQLPSAEDIISVRRQKIMDELQTVVTGEGLVDNYHTMAAEILNEYDPATALAALLKMAFKNDLEHDNYPEIRSFSVDRKGTARLFIAVGRFDGFTPGKLVEMLKRETGLYDKKIDDVRVLDSYSFVTVPFKDAEMVTKKLNRLSHTNKPLAEIAQEAGQSDNNDPRPAGMNRKKRPVDPWERPGAKNRDKGEPWETDDQWVTTPRKPRPADEWDHETMPPRKSRATESSDHWATDAREQWTTAPRKSQSTEGQDYWAKAPRKSRATDGRKARPADSRKPKDRRPAAPQKGRARTKRK